MKLEFNIWRIKEGGSYFRLEITKCRIDLEIAGYEISLKWGCYNGK